MPRAAEIRGPLGGQTGYLSSPWSSPVSGSGGDATHLLPQNIPESMGVEKEIEPAAILRPWLQVIQCCLNGHVANYSSQATSKVGGFLVSEQLSSYRCSA